MHIVAAGPQDAEAVAALAAATFPMACPPGDLQTDIDAFIAAELTPQRFDWQLRQPTRTVLVARNGGELHGYVLVIHEPPVDPEVAAALAEAPTAELSKCYVRADRHGSGLAAQLVDEATACAARRGAAGLWLGVSSVNRRAQRFYRKCGFAPVGHKNFRVGSQHYRDVVMERALGCTTTA